MSFLFALPKVHIRDFSIFSNLDTEYKDAELNAIVSIKNETSEFVKDGCLRISLKKRNIRQINMDKKVFVQCSFG